MKKMRINPFMEIPPAYRMTSVVQSPSTADLFMSSLTAAPRSGSQKKYLVCCLICGSFSCLLGAMFLGIYFLIRSYTFNGYFETVPTYVPAALLILTGLFIVSFAKRKYRVSCLIYFSGVTSATSALTCAAVTVTTKVLHMSRLQDLNLNCEYKITTRICTCYSDFENGPDEARKLLFDAATDCRVAQGDLYSCLQAIFGLSIAGVLVAVFSCMLSYLLYSHERKKMYWEQLDMRCRLLHASHFAGGVGQSAIAFPASIITNNSQLPTCVSCCDQCHATQHSQNLNGISDYPFSPIEFPWSNYANDVCGNSKFLTIAGNNNHQFVPSPHNFHNHFGNFFNSNICFANNHNTMTSSGSAATATTTASRIQSPGYHDGSYINNNHNFNNSTTIIGPEDISNNNNNCNNAITSTIASSTINCNHSNNYNHSHNDNHSNNNNNSNRGWRWPRMPWQRNFDLNLFQQAFLTRPGNFNSGLDFHNWPSFLAAATPQTQYQSQNYINGYPIGMWGPPPPPYSDPNSPNWRTNGVFNSNNHINSNDNDNRNNSNINDNDRTQNEVTNNIQNNSDNLNNISNQLDYHSSLQPPEYSVEPLTIVTPSSLNASQNDNNSINNEISQISK